MYPIFRLDTNFPPTRDDIIATHEHLTHAVRALERGQFTVVGYGSGKSASVQPRLRFALSEAKKAMPGSVYHSRDTGHGAIVVWRLV